MTTRTDIYSEFDLPAEIIAVVQADETRLGHRLTPAHLTFGVADAIQTYQRLMTPLLAVLATDAVGDEDWARAYMSRRAGAMWSYRGRPATHPANSTLLPTGGAGNEHQRNQNNPGGVSGLLSHLFGEPAKGCLRRALVVQSADHLNPNRSGGIFSLSIMACAPIPGSIPIIVLATRDSLWTLLRFLHLF
jgi:hypothetical protein